MSDINPDKPDSAYDPRESAQRWQKEIDAAGKELGKFHRTAKQLVRRYLDERDEGSPGLGSTGASLNLFWSNIEVLKSTLYAKPPNVDVSSAHKDSEDDVARVGGNILQRILNHDVADDADDTTYSEVTKQAVADYLIVGLGQVWYRYEVETAKSMTEEVTDPVTGMVLAPAVEYEAIVEEDCEADYVYWEDFWWSPARTWQEVRWVARRVFMDKEELTERFGKEIAAAVPIKEQGRRAADTISPNRDVWAKAGVFEIWDKGAKKVYWFVPGMDTVLDEKDDPLKLRGFFPCPPMLIANATTSRLIPRADYQLAQDQYAQIDELTTRIKYLAKACKVVGTYDKQATALARVFTEGLENQLIPVDNWAAFAEKGGVAGALSFVPIDTVAEVIERLTAQREVLKANLYEVLGIGDIMRGVTDPDETLGAQQLKAQFGGNRLQFKQQAIGAWVAAGQRIRAQIICDHFQPETILEQSNIGHSPDAELAQAAIQFLKTPGSNKAYRITIEAESMAMVDWAQERDSRTQFMTAVGGFVQSVTPLIQAQPASAPVVLEMMKWGLGGFRIGKEIESVLDKAIASASQPQAPVAPDPEKEAKVAETKAKAFQSETAGVKNLADARAKHVQTNLAPMETAASAAQAMAPPENPAAAPMQPAPMEGTPVPGAPL